MQDYTDNAKKNGVVLIEKGKCQFCGADVEEGIKNCVDISNQGFEYQIDFLDFNNLIYKFLSVDAHTLQHSEIHGRWNNHLHLTRLHLIFKYKIKWTHQSTLKLSKSLNIYKKLHLDEHLTPPKPLERGLLSITDVVKKSKNEEEYKEMIKEWALEVYNCWERHHKTVGKIAEQYINTSG
ncbi:DUF5946 family protein [Tenacibaculum insulae]|uniref:DUF5946 family protein n=1 Tax=Tenacibaculum insulae TaxID=2029677 RepID=UPI003AB60C04